MSAAGKGAPDLAPGTCPVCGASTAAVAAAPSAAGPARLGTLVDHVWVQIGDDIFDATSRQFGPLVSYEAVEKDRGNTLL